MTSSDSSASDSSDSPKWGDQIISPQEIEKKSVLEAGDTTKMKQQAALEKSVHLGMDDEEDFAKTIESKYGEAKEVDLDKPPPSVRKVKKGKKKIIKKVIKWRVK